MKWSSAANRIMENSDKYMLQNGVKNIHKMPAGPKKTLVAQIFNLALKISSSKSQSVVRVSSD